MIYYDKNETVKPDLVDFYSEIDGIKLPIHIFSPEVKNEKNEYVVICIHGGAWRTGRKDNSEWNGGDMIHQARIFAKLGFVGAAISYRSIENENTDILDLINDCKKAVLYVKEKLGFDSEHIILMGDSAGAHLAASLGISDDDEVRPYLVILCNPVLDCMGEFSYASENEKVRKQASPIHCEISNASKFLFIQGDKDTVTPLVNTVKMHERLNGLGFSSELIILKNVLHAFILYNYRSTDEEVENYMDMIIKYIKEDLSKHKGVETKDLK